jgi:hypothetical protein
VTADDGSEFAHHYKLADTLAIPTHFADQYSAYQRGANEHFNGRIRRFAVLNQFDIWVLKSSGDSHVRPGKSDVSRNPFMRSTMPLDSGSRGFNCTNLVARVPWNPITPSARVPRRPIPAS